FTYDSLGRVATSTDGEGHAASFAYDSFGNLVTKTEASGTPEQRTTTYEYGDPTWPSFMTRLQEPSATGSGYKTTAWSWNSDETVLTMTQTGKLTAEGEPVSYVETRAFNAEHQTITIDGPRTDVSDTQSITYYPLRLDGFHSS